MIDLYVGLAVLFAVSAGLAYAAVRWPRAGSRRSGLLLMLGTLAAAALYAVFLWDNVLLARWLPNERVEMADPDVGKEQWTVGDLQVLFQHRGMRLVRRGQE